MARSGPPPTPNEVLRKRGGHGHGWRLSSVTPQSQPLARASSARPPKPPRPLGAAGTVLWNRVWKAGLDWVSPQSDVEMLLATCEMADEYVSLRQQVLAIPPGPLDPDYKRLHDALRDLRKQYLAGLSLLGFSPADRTRLNVGEVVPEDPMEAFRRGDAAS